MNTPPERIYNVSQTQLSIARHYGGCNFNGAKYHYDEETDTLIRMDIHEGGKAKTKKEAKKIAEEEKAKWQKVQSFFDFIK